MGVTFDASDLRSYCEFSGQHRGLTSMQRGMYAIERARKDCKVDAHSGLNLQGVLNADFPDLDGLKGNLKEMSAGTFNSLVESMIVADVLGQPEDVTTPEFNTGIGAMARYEKFANRAMTALRDFQPSIVPEEVWELAQNEIFYRVNRHAWPLGADDVGRFFQWATVTLTNLAREKMAETGHDYVVIFLDDFQHMMVAWRPSIEAIVRGTGPLVRDLLNKVVKKLIIEVVKFLVKLIKTVVLFVVDVIIRVLKTIPYTCWLGYILGYVVFVIEFVVEIFI